MDESALNLRKCYQTLEILFPQITCDVGNDELCGGEYSGNITITRLNGESFDTAYNPSMTVVALKKRIEQFLNVPSEKQNLLHNGHKLEVCIELSITTFFYFCFVTPPLVTSQYDSPDDRDGVSRYVSGQGWSVKVCFRYKVFNFTLSR